MLKKRIQSHNLSHLEMKELKYQQQMGEQVFVPANRNEKTGREHMIPEIEQHLVHVEYFTAQFNRNTGAPEHVVQTNTFSYAEFKKLESDGAFTGMKVTILHMPEDPTITSLKKMREENLQRIAEEQGQGGHASGLTPPPGASFVNGPGEDGNIGTGAGTGEGGNTSAPAVKSLSSMNKAELTELYTATFGVAPDPAVTVAELKDLIKEKQDEAK